MSVTMLERKPGVWRLRVETLGPDGARRHRYQTIKGSRRDADVARARLLLSLEAEQKVGGGDAPAEAAEAPRRALAARGDVTIGAYADAWMTNREALGAFGINTADMYRAMLVHVRAQWGAKPLRDLTRGDVVEGLAKLARAGKSPRTVRHIHARLVAVLKDAVLDGIIRQNVAVDVPLPKVARSAGRIMSDDQRALLLQRMRAHRLGRLVRFMLATGLRRGEVCGLLWQHVDLDGSVVRVERVLAQRGNSREVWVKEPKTAAGRRTVKLPEATVADLRAMQAEHAAVCRELGWDLAEQPVWISATGEAWRPGRLTEALTEVMADAGLEGFTPHDLRHIHASALLRARQNPRAVSQRLGHTDVATTLGIYGHVLPGDDDTLAEAIGEVLR